MRNFLILLPLLVGCSTHSPFPSQIQRTPQSRYDEKDGLTDYEGSLLRFYTDGAYSYLNYMLRKSVRQWEGGTAFDVIAFEPQDPQVLSSMRGESPEDFHNAYVRFHYQLDSVLERLESIVSPVLYRGVKSREHLDGLTKGGVFRDHAYVSTSVDREIAEKFSRQDPRDPQTATGVLWEIEAGAKGTYASVYSFSPHEAEIVLRPGSLFEVVDIVPPQGTRRYVLLKLKQLLPGKLSAAQIEKARAFDAAHKATVIRSSFGNNAEAFARERAKALGVRKSPLTMIPDLPESYFME
ncbi:MAG: hypothetical protein EB060_11800 [Proteobacteria bacterium]|nr:hypothetical protein [Pseudomonadota bacterium]